MCSFYSAFPVRNKDIKLLRVCSFLGTSLALTHFRILITCTTSLQCGVYICIYVNIAQSVVLYGLHCSFLVISCLKFELVRILEYTRAI